MRANEHDLNSLRGIVRKLQEEKGVLRLFLGTNLCICAKREERRLFPKMFGMVG